MQCFTEPTVEVRLDQIYLDKLDGKVAEGFWLRKTQEWQLEEQRIMLAMQALAEAKPDRMLDGVRILAELPQFSEADPVFSIG